MYDEARTTRFCEAVFDALCPRWRRDAVVPRTSVPTGYNHVAHGFAKMEASARNYTYSRIEGMPGLVTGVRVAWGQSATDTWSLEKGLNWYCPDDCLPILVCITVDPTKVAVAGDALQTGTTRRRLWREAKNVVQNMYFAQNAGPDTGLTKPQLDIRVEFVDLKVEKK